jgi:hypothetical protein
MMFGDVGAELAGLCVVSGDRQRDAARTERDALEILQQQQQESEIQALKDKARSILDRAIAEGVGTCVEGGMTICGSVAGLRTPAGDHPLPGTFCGLSEAGWRGGGTLAGGLGQGIGGYFDSVGADDDASAARAHAAAAHYASLVQDEGDDIRGASSFLQSAIDFCREYEATQAQIRQTAIHVA